VVPWIGFSLNTIIKLVEPTAKAKYVAFQSFYDLKQMPQSRGTGLGLSLRRRLRLDEAMNPLTLLCVGMYAKRCRIKKALRCAWSSRGNMDSRASSPS